MLSLGVMLLAREPQASLRMRKDATVTILARALV